MRCEDYPCCGHTPEDPCDRQWYDEPDAFDTTRNPHAFCEHAEGFCDVEEEEEDYDLSGSYDDAVGPDEMEDQWLDGSYEE